jgi:hypothetical protein
MLGQSRVAVDSLEAGKEKSYSMERLYVVAGFVIRSLTPPKLLCIVNPNP